MSIAHITNASLPAIPPIQSSSLSASEQSVSASESSSGATSRFLDRTPDRIPSNGQHFPLKEVGSLGSSPERRLPKCWPGEPIQRDWTCSGCPFLGPNSPHSHSMSEASTNAQVDTLQPHKAKTEPNSSHPTNQLLTPQAARVMNPPCMASLGWLPKLPKSLSKD